MTVPPFVAGPPLEPARLFGRQSLLEEIAQTCCEARGSFALYGDHRVGKTSVLHYLDRKQPGKKRRITPIYVLVDCSSIIPLTFDNFWRQVLSRLARKESLPPLVQQVTKELLSLSQPIDPVSDTGKLLKQAENADMRLILLLDEFEFSPFLSVVKRETPEAAYQHLGVLRSLCVQPVQDGRLQLVLVSVKPISRLLEPVYEAIGLSKEGSPFYNSFTIRRVAPFAPEDVSAFIPWALASTGIQFDQKEIGYIRQIAGTTPYLVQLAAEVVFQKKVAGVPQIQDFPDIGRQFLDKAQFHFEELWRASSTLEQLLLMLLALKKMDGRLNRSRRFSMDDLDRVFNRYQRALLELEQRGLVHRVGGDPEIASSLLEWWVLTQIENSQVTEIEQRELRVGNLLTAAELNKLREVLQAVNANRDALTSFVQWAARLVMPH